ncbi:GH1 family beta-glucosidase [Aeromicrobium sp. IC_218]|uniref:GH1 family beta-glucosidase n=1 Tax=Aeromicrobium sp. IC_218 TaxID=2545468 RepID=UPI00103D539D|nr:GH1 family beta-glucosidase [Aeromicrobium sp. IC_218]TCI96039.1 beta-glucosidase [Aeromicrobium sp. IC_218]
MTDLQLGPDFVWGVATASYQVEGAVTEDGRGPSAWDVFASRPGTVREGHTGDVACDHFHRYREDVALMADLGVDAYRFSVAWPRVMPDGLTVEPRGLDFYERLVDALLEKGIQPSATLFHWDTPQALEDRGGWESRDVAERFAEYAGAVAERLGDRVTRWMTLNEPVVLTMMGHATGRHAPGKQLGFGALQVALHQLLAHGRGVQALRAAGATEVGIANNHVPVWPSDERPESAEAAAFFDCLYNRLFLDPLLLGEWGVDGFEDLVEGVRDDDLATIGQPIDFLGVNYYNPQAVGAPGTGTDPAVVDGAMLPPDLPFTFHDIDSPTHSDFGWPIVPAGLTEVLVALRQRYGDRLPPIYITENGGAFNEEPDEHGRVADQRRIAYTEAHLQALRAAMDAGVDVRGYFHWSLMDNFEWAEGYAMRFGLVHVDFETLARTPKDSFAWYRDVIASQQR